MAKGIMYIDGQRVPFDGEKNVLAVIRKAGIDMPTFCYYSELSTFGACRMCVVEDERGKIDTSCSMEPRDGMVIKTNTTKLLKHRRMILELMLASHNCNCTRLTPNCSASSCRWQLPLFSQVVQLQLWEASISSRIIRRCFSRRAVLVRIFMPSRGGMEQEVSILPRSSSTTHIRQAPYTDRSE